MSDRCVECNVRKKEKRHDREGLRSRCSSCRKGTHPYLKFKQKFCCRCNFVAENSCQLDVDHIDGNHSNNDPSNLQTLCANCHRLKTFENKDWDPKTPVDTLT